MSTHVITVYAGCPECGTLELSDTGYCEVDPGSEIEWLIENRPSTNPNAIEVDSIDEIEIESGDKIFKVHPKKDGRKLKGEIKTGLGKGKKCKYLIHWTSGNQSHKYDPIIAVKPTALLEPIPLPRFITGIAVGLASIFTLQFLLRKAEKHR